MQAAPRDECVARCAARTDPAANDPKTDPALNQQSGGNALSGPPGPQVLDSNTASNLGQPQCGYAGPASSALTSAAKDELKKRSEELNK